MTFKFEGNSFTDDRGVLRFVNSFDFSNVKRFYQVENHSKGFIRAWHGHLKEEKYVYVVKGTALFGVCDLDENMNLGKPEKHVLSSEKPVILHIPKSKANGFKTLTENTIILFFSSTTLEESQGDDYRFRHDVTEEHDKFWKEDYR